MGLNLSKAGVSLPPSTYTYTQDDVILYALGIGAGVDGELDFVYEKNLRVFPSFCVVPPSVEVANWHRSMGINIGQLLQLSHQIELFAPIPTFGTVTTTTVYDPIYDRGEAGALIHMTGQTRDADGRLLFVNRCRLLDRSAGHFGGDSGPVEPKVIPQEGRAPDFQTSYATSANQAAVYRLSGDKNPLHIDPNFSLFGGFKRPILHGLCTFGIACRAIVHELCHGNPVRLRSLSAHFTGVVYPGETLVVQGWRIRPDAFAVRTQTTDGRHVLQFGVAEVV